MKTQGKDKNTTKKKDAKLKWETPKLVNDFSELKTIVAHSACGPGCSVSTSLSYC